MTRRRPRVLDRTIALRLCVLAALAALAAGGCSEAPPPPAEQPAARHVVLVTIDTLRADRLGAYGGDVATPHLDALARDGALVADASAHVPLTRPSHVALMSGRLPTETGVRDNVSPSTIPDVPLLAEVFERRGFATAAFVSSVVVAASSGLDRGFDLYSDDFDADPNDPSFLNTAQKSGDRTVADAVAWLQDRPDGRFFLWLHLYDPHEPYEPPEPYASRYAGRPYAGEVAWTDELVGRLDEALQRLGLAGETLVVATSDHGEGLGQHEELLHGFFAYESTLRVPLLLRGPGVVAGTRLERPTGLVDLYPTLLKMAGVDVPAGTVLAGRSFATALGGGAELPEEPLYAETLVPRLQFGWSDLRVVRDGRWKLIRAPHSELYDLLEDPDETKNVLGERRAEARRLSAALDGFLAREGAAEASGEADPELLEKLAALGYLGGTEPASTSTPGADPKDKIAEFRLANRLMRDALARLHDKDYETSAARLGELLELGIESAEIHLYLGRAHLGRGDFRQAAVHFREAAARSPERAEVWTRLAAAEQQAGDGLAALAALRSGHAALPRHAGLYREEARLLRLLGRVAESRRPLQAALAIADDDAESHAMLGEALRAGGDVAAALAEMRRAVEVDPSVASYWNTLGMTLGGSGDLAGAEDAFRQAWRLDPTRHLHAYNLGLVLLRLGRGGEARPFFEKALELAPEFTPARQRLAELQGSR